MIRYISTDDLAAMTAAQKEADLLIVDIRPEEAYCLDHIPGAVNLPLQTLDFDALAASGDRDVVFYCRSGVRSKAAALFAADAGIPESRIFHLDGGMMAYTGEILLDAPRLALFDTDLPPEQVMARAVDLEKGARLFYEQAGQIFRNRPCHDTMDRMCRAETAHARAIFRQMNRIRPRNQSFEDYFDSLDGRILEGGTSLAEAAAFLDDAGPDRFADILEFALEVEYTAFDLYRVMAEKVEEKVLRELFLSLAQAEKAHLREIVQALAEF